jgi:hypothetical protein
MLNLSQLALSLRIPKEKQLQIYPFNKRKARLMQQEKQSVTAEKVVQILEKHGTKITPEEAKIILDFLYKFGKLTLKHLLRR